MLFIYLFPKAFRTNWCNFTSSTFLSGNYHLTTTLSLSNFEWRKEVTIWSWKKFKQTEFRNIWQHCYHSAFFQNVLQKRLFSKFEILVTFIFCIFSLGTIVIRSYGKFVGMGCNPMTKFFTNCILLQCTN